ncbi:MAG: hypothetical protein RBU27_14565 [Bacteroidota bacterium]|jgi:hypothetical protein|nr:hypothetical protein [Bacteroidota bacterium]
MTTEPGQIDIVDLGLAAKARPMLVIGRLGDQKLREVQEALAWMFEIPVTD